MANSITLAERFLPILDGIYKRESTTAILEGANRNIRFLGGNAVEILRPRWTAWPTIPVRMVL